MRDHHVAIRSDASRSHHAPRSRFSIGWVLLVCLLIGILAALWYWNARPAHVQAAVAAVRETAQRHDVMTVEALSEAGQSIVGRHVSIGSARVIKVTGERTFWVAGSEGDPLLVVIAAPANGGSLKLSQGDRISLNGVMHAGVGEVTGTEDRAAVASAPFYLLALELEPVRQ